MAMWRRGIVCAAAVVAACGGASGSDIDDPAGARGVDAAGGGGPETSTPIVDGGTTPVVDSPAPLVCAAGTADCDGDAANGCETNTNADDGRCGGCAAANACASGTSCQAGKCVTGPATIVPANTFVVNDAVCIGIDAQYVYVASGRSQGDVYRVAKTGGAPISIAPNQGAPRGIATDPSSVYWASAGSGILTTAKPDGTNATPFDTGSAGSNTIAVDAQGIYWGNSLAGTVGRVDKNGANAKQLAPAVGTLGQGHIGNVAVAGGIVFYTDPVAGQVMRVPADGSAVPSLVASATNARGLAVVGTNVLFTTSIGGGSVGIVAASGPPAQPTPVASAQGNPVSVAGDASGTYWANGGAVGAIMKKAAAVGSIATPLATTQAYPACIAIDATSVYWINQSGASVMRVAK